MENVKKSRQIIRNRQLQRRIVVKLMADKTRDIYIKIKMGINNFFPFPFSKGKTELSAFLFLIHT
ncbi:MAG: hypothetical protein ACK56I_01800, partial [bacterium]